MTDAASLRRVDLCAVDDVSPGTMKLCDVDGDLVLVVNLRGEFHATQGICSHQYFELDKGFLTGDSITCALHLSRFNLSDGEPLDPPAEMPLVVYPVVVEAGRVLIAVPPGPLEGNRAAGTGRAAGLAAPWRRRGRGAVRWTRRVSGGAPFPGRAARHA
jgi:3-phenylpropionate/trans-cinnamate dioxygenase ferredoxin component